MNATIRFGRIRGISIGAHWSVLVILVLLADVLATSTLPAYVKNASHTAYWTVGVFVAVAFLLTLAAHETAHAVVARRAGMTVKSITLWMLGGVTELEGDPPDARSDLRIAVAGPAVSLGCGALGAAAAFLLRAVAAPRVLVAGVGWLAVSNVLLGVFNLLPGAPLDGGRVVRALVWRRTGDRDRAEMVATKGGRATGLVLIWLGITEAVATANIVGGVWLMLIGWFLISAAVAEQQETESARALRGLTVADVMQTSFTYLPAYLDVTTAARRAVDVGDDFFPVCDLDGRPVGMVDAERLVESVQLHRRDLTVIDVSIPLRPEMTAAPTEPLVLALRRAGRSGLLAVFDQGRLVGIVTPGRVRNALRRSVVAAEPAQSLVSQR